MDEISVWPSHIGYSFKNSQGTIYFHSSPCKCAGTSPTVATSRKIRKRDMIAGRVEPKDKEEDSQSSPDIYIRTTLSCQKMDYKFKNKSLHPVFPKFILKLFSTLISNLVEHTAFQCDCKNNLTWEVNVFTHQGFTFPSNSNSKCSY